MSETEDGWGRGGAPLPPPPLAREGGPGLSDGRRERGQQAISIAGDDERKEGEERGGGGKK